MEGFLCLLLYLLTTLITCFQTSFSLIIRSPNAIYATATFTDNSNGQCETYDAQLTSYSDSPQSASSGHLYDPPEGIFTCSHTSNMTYKIPEKPFIVFLPLPECDPYTLALIAEEIGAMGVVFYTTSETTVQSSENHSSVTVIVAVLTLTDGQVSSLLNWTNTSISVFIEEPPTHNKSSLDPTILYLIILTVSVVFLLSVTWFIITYSRRCNEFVKKKRRKRQTQKRTMEIIKQLPTKEYKLTKFSDSCSHDEPTCSICLDAFKQNECIRILPCKHEFHQVCVDPWLKRKGICPLCKYNLIKKHSSSVTSIASISINHNVPGTDGV